VAAFAAVADTPPRQSVAIAAKQIGLNDLLQSIVCSPMIRMLPTALRFYAAPNP
jgi:hypothetical protein